MSEFNKLAAAADLWIELGLTKQAGKLESAVENAAKVLRNRPLMGGVGAVGTAAYGYHKYKKGPDGKSKLDKELELARKIELLQQESGARKKSSAMAKLRRMHQELAEKNPYLMASLEGLGGGGLFAGASHLLRAKTASAKLSPDAHTAINIALGGTLGALVGNKATDKEESKLRNTAIGALTGGLAVGGAHHLMAKQHAKKMEAIDSKLSAIERLKAMLRGNS